MKERNNEHVIVGMIRNGIFEVHEDGSIWRTVGGKYYKKNNPKSKTKHEPVYAEKSLPNGYKQIRTLIDGKRYHCYSHRIIWILNNGNIPENMQVNHKNSIKSDNRIENLELLTASENRKHAYIFKDFSKKLDCMKVRDIRNRYKNCNITMTALATEYGVEICTIDAAIKRRTWSSIE